MCSLAHVLLDNGECLGLSLPDKARSLIMVRDVGVEPLLPHIEKSTLRCFGQLIMMPPGFLLLEVFEACPTGRRPHGRPGGGIIYPILPRNILGSPRRAFKVLQGRRISGIPSLAYCHPDLVLDKWKIMDGLMGTLTLYSIKRH